jgi:ABC-type transport system involved in multi-copper enzyme maturation permease subunit
MLLPPVIERELKTALRKGDAPKARLRVARWAAVAAGVFILLSFVKGSSIGPTFHRVLFVWALFLAVVRPLQFTAGLFAEERRNQTLELLFLAGMSSGELFLTKLLSGMIVASSELLALVPFLTLPFLVGGVSLELFVATLVCLPTLLIFTLSVSIFASVLCKDDSQALLCAAIVGGVLSIATPLIDTIELILAGPLSLLPDLWLCASPGYGPFLVGTHSSLIGKAPFWNWTLITWLWSTFFLCSAAFILNRTWRHDPDQFVGVRWRHLWRSIVRGSKRTRSRLRRKLEANPFQWLVEQYRRPVVTAWALIVALSALWTIGLMSWQHRWLNPANFFAAAILLILPLEWLELHAAATRIAKDRSDGTLELLLTTPLTPREITEGQISGVRSQFRPVRRTVAGVCLAMMIGGLFTRTWNLPAMISYIGLWGLALTWAITGRPRAIARVMWIALNSGRSTLAVMRCYGAPWAWVWLLINVRLVLKHFGGTAFPSGSPTELILVVFAGVMTLIILAAKGREPDVTPHRLAHEMRCIAQEPLPSHNDPRFKHWDSRERFPVRRQAI